MKKALLYLFILFTFLSPTHELKCDRVIELPPNLDTLIPDHHKVNKIHVSHYFFLEKSIEQKFTFDIKDKSIFKLQLIPHHAVMTVTLHFPSGKVETLSSTYPEMNLDYTDLRGISNGKVEMKIKSEDPQIPSNLSDEICSLPYFRMEFYIQDVDSFNEKTLEIKKENKNLEPFDLNFEKYLRSLPYENELKEYKIPFRNKNEDKNLENLNILREFSFTYDQTKTAFTKSIKRLLLNINFFSDFLISGSLDILILRDEDKQLINDFACLKDGKCIISQRNSKNILSFSASLTPGSYVLFIVDSQKKEAFVNLSKYLDYIPVSLKLSISESETQEDEFNCDGIHLPNNILIENAINFKENYEFNNQVLMNLGQLYDFTFIKTDYDSIFRVSAFHLEGVKINIELYLKEILIEKVESSGETTGLIYSLKKGQTYKLVFNYDKSIFDELRTQEKCHKFHLRLGVISQEYIHKAFNFPINCIHNENENLNKLFNAFEAKHSEPSNYIDKKFVLDDNFQYNVINDQSQTGEIIFVKDIDIKAHINLNLEIISDFTSSLIVPVVKRDNETKKEFEHQLERMSYINGIMNVNLKPGKYELTFLRGKNQFHEKKPKFEFIHSAEHFPKCSVFSVKITSILISTELQEKWCNGVNFATLPLTLNNIRDISHDNQHVSYYHPYILYPYKEHNITIKTGNNQYFIKLTAEFKMLKPLNIHLMKKDKVLRTARTFKNKLYESNSISLTYLLKAETEYTIHFLYDAEEDTYFNNCNTFALQIELTNKKYLDMANNHNRCPNIVPRVETAFYERQIGQNSPIHQSGRRVFHFGYFFRRRFVDHNDSQDINTVNNKVFSYQKSFRPYIYKLKFRVRFLYSKLTVRIENHFETNLAIYISRRIFNNEEIVAKGELVNSNTIEIKGLNIDAGEYELTIEETSFNRAYNQKFQYCNRYTLFALLENGYFHHPSRFMVNSQSNQCNLLQIPSNLNIPGWLSPDTDRSLNVYSSFMLSEKNYVFSFSLKEKSIFKIHIPPFNRIGYYLKITKLKKRKNIDIVQIPDSSDLNVIKELDLGNYKVEIAFREVDGVILNLDKTGCSGFDLNLNILPINKLYPHISDNSVCTEKLLTQSFISETSKNYESLIFKKIYKSDSEIINRPTIQIDQSAAELSEFIGEFIINPYSDTSNHFEVTESSVSEVSKKKEEVKVPFRTVYEENFAWVIFDVLPNKHYTITINSITLDRSTQICSKQFFSYSYMKKESENKVQEGEENNIAKEGALKEICPVNDLVPESIHNSHEAKELEKYGGIQKEDGSIKFLGTFAVPNKIKSNRVSIMIHHDSMIFVKAIPKYQKNNNIKLQIFRDKKLIFKYSHSLINGVLMTFLRPFSTPYILEIDFEEHDDNAKCDTFELAIVITPKESYKQLLECNENYDKIPPKLSISKSTDTVYNNYYSQGTNKLRFTLDQEKNHEYNLDINITKMFSINVNLRYSIILNFMEVYLTNGDGQNTLVNPKETLEINQDLDGIYSIKALHTKLKPGNYKIRLVFKSIFTQLTRSILFVEGKKEFEVCHPFTLDISTVKLDKVLKDKHLTVNAKDETQVDTEENSPDFDLTTKSDLVDEKIDNFILSVEPASEKNIKLNHEFHIIARFEHMLKKNLDLSKSAYLQEFEGNKTLGNKIYPSDSHMHRKKLDLSFNTASLAIKKCYRLFFDFSAVSVGNKKIMYDEESVNVYCTIKCECNPNATYKCNKKHECECKFPYKGEKCYDCEKGYIKGEDGKCINEKQEKCDDKQDCNSHGRCIKNTEEGEKNCECDEGFSSRGDSFCNICTDIHKYYPFCGEIENKLHRQIFNWNSDCYDSSGNTLPPSMTSDIENPKFQGIYLKDGTMIYHAVLKIKEEIETTEIHIEEESLIRIMFHSKSNNRAKIMIVKNKEDTRPISATDGNLQNESLIAKLNKRKSPYIIRIIHSNLFGSCNRFEIMISVKTLNNSLKHMKCSSKTDKSTILPDEKIKLGDINSYKENLNYLLPEGLVFKMDIGDTVKVDNFNMHKVEDPHPVSYVQTGILSKAKFNEEFIYNMEINVVNHPVVFSSTISYDFLTNEMSLTLRDSNGHVIEKGEQLIPSVENFTHEGDMINRLSKTLEPGRYYLTINQDISANLIVQILNEEKEFRRIQKCFDFNLHIQESVINKPDPETSTAKFESMYNRIIDVEPPTLNNVEVKQKFAVILTFEFPISHKIKEKKLSEAFYLKNKNSKKFIYPDNVYIQDSKSNSILIQFGKKALKKDECYELKYELTHIVSLDHDKKIVSDSPIIHRYCTKECDCNPFTDFECGDDDKCICESPYKGPGCLQCKTGYLMAHFKCQDQETCNENYCNNHGKCILKTNKPDEIPKCECEENFRGSPECDKCTNPNFSYPECMSESALSNELDQESNPHDKNTEIKNIENEDTEKFGSQEDEFEFNCNHEMVPASLDTLGFLKLNNHLHLSGKYSIKHVNNKHYSMKFTLKERSHFKAYFELSKPMHNLQLILVKGEEKTEGVIKYGPKGEGSSTLFDAILDSNKENESYELRIYITDLGLVKDNGEDEDEVDTDILINDCFNVYLELAILSVEKENSDRNKGTCNENLPNQLFQSDIRNLDKNTELISNKYAFRRSDKEYFFQELAFVHDLNTKDLSLFLQVNSVFLHSQVGILIEILEIPKKINGREIDMRTINLSELKSHYNDPKPECKSHCFTGYKKLNSVVIDRIIPSNTLLRIWLYDIKQNQQYMDNSCIEFEVNYSLSFNNPEVNPGDKQYEVSICPHNFLPVNLNEKSYLGDNSYIKKWGFHILDFFRVDDLISKGFTHNTNFYLDSPHVFRIIITNSRIDLDLELYSINTNKNELLVSSSSKDVENAIAIELPKGDYQLRFKFYPSANGFYKCESIQMEFAIHKIEILQENIDRMADKFNGKLTGGKIHIYDHLNKANPEDLFHNSGENQYLIETKRPSSIGNESELEKDSSETISELKFIITNEQNRKIELAAFTSSDFSLIDAAPYLTDLKSGKTIKSVHKKNQNILYSGVLETGEYTLSVRYYKRFIRSVNGQIISHLKNDNFAEVEFNAVFINISDDELIVKSDKGKIHVQPEKKVVMPHYWKCRNHGSVIPKSLNNLHFIEFTRDIHIIDHYIAPNLNEGEARIKFSIKHLLRDLMIRIYVEAKENDINVKLNKHGKGGSFEVLDESKENTHFTSLMAILKTDFEYEIIIYFKNANRQDQDCTSFRMEIATESSHNYACPIENNKYVLLTDLSEKIPKSLPVMENKKPVKYIFNSKDHYRGEMKGEGFAYMLRTEKDTEYQFASFVVNEEVDLKIQITHDFVQAPLNIFIIQSNNFEKDLKKEINKSLAVKKSRINDSNILAFGELFENRSELIIKNLPLGIYSIYVYLPGLKTHFYKERVCSIYDLLFEVAKSHKINNKIQSIYGELKEDQLDLPIPLQTTFNSIAFWGENNYVNYNNNFFLYKTSVTGEYFNESVSLELKENSIVRLQVRSIQDKVNDISIRIKDKSDFSDSLYLNLQKGKYVLEIKETLNKNQKDALNNNISKEIFNFLIGISSTSRLQEIYKINNISQSCSTVSLPTSLNLDNHSFKQGDKTLIRYENQNITVKTSDIHDKSISKINLILKENSKFYGEISGDHIIFPIQMKIKSQLHEWVSVWTNNVGVLSISLNPGNYELHIYLENEILDNSISCIFYGLSINIYDIKISSSLISQESNSEEILAPIRCESSHILPVEISTRSSDSTSRINGLGDFSLHYDKLLHHDSQSIEQSNHDSNSITISVDQSSIIRVTTQVSDPHNYKIVPSLVLRKEKPDPKKVLKTIVKEEPVNEGIETISHNLEERNLAYFLKENSSSDYYELRLSLELGNHFSHSKCPYYSFDLLVSSAEQMVKRLLCPFKEGKTLKYKDPKSNFNVAGKYNEFIEFSYFTENQIGEFIQKKPNETGSFSYSITFDVHKKSTIKIEFGYDHQASLFDIYLNRFEKFDRGNVFESRLLISGHLEVKSMREVFPYKKVIDTEIEPGNYILIITETIFPALNNQIHSYLNEMKDSRAKEKFCVPFSYKIDIEAIPEGKFVRPELISYSPKGPLVFLQKNEEFKIILKFNSELFTERRQSITSTSNYVYLLDVFYLAERNIKKDGEGIQKEISEIFPERVEGSEDNKEWEIFFPTKKLDINNEYQFKIKPRKLFDHRHVMLHFNPNLPLLRLEIESEKMKNENLNTDKIDLEEQMDKLRKEAGDDVEGFSIDSQALEPINDKNKLKCGKHGKEFYDNIYKKWVCNCVDGFTGKKCDICEGEIDKETGHCIEDADTGEDEEVRDKFKDKYDDENEDEIKIKEKEYRKKKDSEKHDSYGKYADEKGKKDKKEKVVYKPCESCHNGYCNGKLGQCICNEGWKGEHCDVKIEVLIQQSSKTEEVHSDSGSWSGLFFKSILYVVIIVSIIISYITIRKYYYTSPIEYKPLSGLEHENKHESHLELYNDDNDIEELHIGKPPKINNQ